MAYDKVIIHGGQICDYLYIQNNAIDDNEFNSVEDEPTEWKNNNTTLYVNFNDKENRLMAGNSKLIGSIEGYEIFRKKYNDSQAKYVCTVQKSEDSSGDFILDYSVKNGVDYTYYLYPNNNSPDVTALSAFTTKQLSIDCPYWSLFIVDETENENIFYLDKMFKFELNIEEGDMSNNAQITINQNFTRYPTLQYGSSNYWSGNLSALCGFLSVNDTDYIQTVDMINELKEINYDTRRKFLKDIDGNLWEVAISAPISISTDKVTLQRIKSITFTWVEINDANNISIINNPNKSITDWVLTENGVAIPNYIYKWDNQSIWDNSYLWTSHNNTTNLGRKILKSGGDE